MIRGAKPKVYTRISSTKFAPKMTPRLHVFFTWFDGTISNIDEQTCTVTLIALRSNQQQFSFIPL